MDPAPGRQGWGEDGGGGPEPSAWTGSETGLEQPSERKRVLVRTEVVPVVFNESFAASAEGYVPAKVWRDATGNLVVMVEGIPEEAASIQRGLQGTPGQDRNKQPGNEVEAASIQRGLHETPGQDGKKQPGNEAEPQMSSTEKKSAVPSSAETMQSIKEGLEAVVITSESRNSPAGKEKPARKKKPKST